jgi:hypothetical protein
MVVLVERVVSDKGTINLLHLGQVAVLVLIMQVLEELVELVVLLERLGQTEELEAMALVQV